MSKFKERIDKAAKAQVKPDTEKVKVREIKPAVKPGNNQKGRGKGLPSR